MVCGTIRRSCDVDFGEYATKAITTEDVVGDGSRRLRRRANFRVIPV